MSKSYWEGKDNLYLAHVEERKDILDMSLLNASLHGTLRSLFRCVIAQPCTKSFFLMCYSQASSETSSASVLLSSISPLSYVQQLPPQTSKNIAKAFELEAGIHNTA